MLRAEGEAHAATSSTVCGSQANANTRKNSTPNTQARPSEVERGTFETNRVYRFTVISHQRPRGDSDYLAARAHVAGLPQLTVLRRRPRAVPARTARAQCHKFLRNHAHARESPNKYRDILSAHTHTCMWARTRHKALRLQVDVVLVD